MRIEITWKDDFQDYSTDGKTTVVKKVDGQILSDALLGRIQGDPLKPGATGRGEVRRVDLEDGQAVIRPCRRGGMIGQVMGDYFFLIARPAWEHIIHRHLFEQGLSVPEPLGYLCEQRGLFFRGAIATRYVDGRDLLTFLKNESSDCAEVLGNVGRLIRSMHDLGANHADLNGGNILVKGEAAYLLDFDKATLHKKLSTLKRGRNLLRLRRSLDKHGVDPQHFQAIVDGYGLPVISPLLSRLYQIKGSASDALAGRR
jgi:3-deoxy-D-manno-octulosonic acid kinase